MLGLRNRSAVVAALTPCCLGLVACGGATGDGEQASSSADAASIHVAERVPLRPAPGAQPVRLRRDVIANVGGTHVTRTEFSRAYAIAASSDRKQHAAHLDAHERRAIQTRAAMSRLVQAAAITQRAKAARVTVSATQVNAALAKQRKSFATTSHWRRFLRESNQTVTELRSRLRLQLLTRSLYVRHISTVVEPSAICRSGYVIDLCRNAYPTPTKASR